MNSRAKTTITSSENSFSQIDFIKVAFIVLSYFFANRVSFIFPDSAKAIMLFWPAGGIGLASFLLSKKRLWPILAASLYISGITADILFTNRSFLTSFGYMTGNMVESITCAWFISKISGRFQKFTRIREVAALIISTIFINAISACIGAGTAALTQGASFIKSWGSWYIADGFGILLVGPFIVSWISDIKEFVSSYRFNKVIEWATYFIVWSFISYSIFYYTNDSDILRFEPYMLVALIAWPAVRMGVRGVTAGLLLLIIIAIFSPAIINGPSPLGIINYNYDHRLLELQLYLAFMASIGYLMSAGYASLKRTELALRKSETEFRKTFELASIGKSIVSINGEFIKSNNALANMLGYTLEELTKIKLIDITHPEEIEIIKEGFRNLLSEKIESLRFEKRFIMKNKKIIWVDTNIILSKDPFGKPDHFISHFLEISERKKSQDIIEKSLREKEILLKEIHHRVKNNFQKIISLISLQTELIDDKKTLGVFSDLQNRLLSMSLIHELMYSTGDFENVDVKDYVERLSEHLLRTYSLSSRVKLNLDVDSFNIDMDSIIPCGLIINEIITNSLKYAFPDNTEGKINVSFKKKENEYNLIISDDGIGIMKKIDFENLNSLGLHLVELLTRQLRGSLEVVQPGKGLLFNIKFKMES